MKFKKMLMILSLAALPLAARGEEDSMALYKPKLQALADNLGRIRQFTPSEDWSNQTYLGQAIELIQFMKGLIMRGNPLTNYRQAIDALSNAQLGVEGITLHNKIAAIINPEINRGLDEEGQVRALVAIAQSCETEYVTIYNNPDFASVTEQERRGIVNPCVEVARKINDSIIGTSTSIIDKVRIALLNL